jgi:hypothetical protein
MGGQLRLPAASALLRLACLLACLLACPRGVGGSSEATLTAAVLRGWSPAHSPAPALAAADIALIQYDTRPLGPEYWGVAARWNYAFARKHGHPYYYFSSAETEECLYSDISISIVWCKVCVLI